MESFETHPRLVCLENGRGVPSVAIVRKFGRKGVIGDHLVNCPGELTLEPVNIALMDMKYWEKNGKIVSDRCECCLK